MYNTIILKSGAASLTKGEWEKFEKGETICGNNSEPEELKRWPAEQEEEALEELKKHHCEYWKAGDSHEIREYALEHFQTDEDGEFLEGSDYELAEEA